ncbi:MAG: bacteriohemerythrin [Sulfuritalea sp.]|nr:bacteriohemerythrin [Sulfuritalea sp.]
MEKITWKPSFSVGHPILDQHHQTLVEITNRLVDARGGNSRIAETFELLDDYVSTHFRLEESLLAATDMDNLEEHFASHRSFTNWLEAVKASYNAGGASSFYITETVVSYLKNWLVSHILVTDMQYKGKINEPD